MNDIPIGAEYAVNYDDLRRIWNVSAREVRNRLHELSAADNGDGFVLIRSSRGGGFYWTDDPDDIRRYRREIINRGRNVFANVRKIDRILADNVGQGNLFNNLRTAREMKEMRLVDVVYAIAPEFQLDMPTLSKMERGIVLPSRPLLKRLSDLYGVPESELIKY